MEDLPKNIDVIDFTEKEPENKVEPVILKEAKVEQNVSKYEPDIKEIKKEEIKKFNEDPKTKDFKVKLVTKTTILSFYVIIAVLLLLLFVNIVWHNTIFNKLADKEFNPIISNQINPNITANITANVTTNVNVPTSNEFYNNFTINLTVILPNNLNLNITNSS
jgi:hypothetical protein